MINNYKYTENAFLPKTVFIPLLQEKNGSCKPVVKVGEFVTEGQVIASSDSSSILRVVLLILENLLNQRLGNL